MSTARTPCDICKREAHDNGDCCSGCSSTYCEICTELYLIDNDDGVCVLCTDDVKWRLLLEEEFVDWLFSGKDNTLNAEKGSGEQELRDQCVIELAATGKRYQLNKH